MTVRNPRRLVRSPFRFVIMEQALTASSGGKFKQDQINVTSVSLAPTLPIGGRLLSVELLPVEGSERRLQATNDTTGAVNVAFTVEYPDSEINGTDADLDKNDFNITQLAASVESKA